MAKPFPFFSLLRKQASLRLGNKNGPQKGHFYYLTLANLSQRADSGEGLCF